MFKPLFMIQKKTILVTGATGAQGGSVAKAMLTNGTFAVRALTRNATSDAAIALKKAGAEIVTGDFDDIESLKEAMKDVYGVFGLTNFWEHYGHEFQHGKNLIDAAHQSGIQHFVYSSLADYKKLSNGEYEVPHCDLKAALRDYAKSLQIPATFTHIGFYYENFFNFFPPQRREDGSCHFGFPQGDTRLAMASVEDIGGVVASIFNHPDEYIGRTVGIVGADDTCEQYAALMTEVLGEKIIYDYIPREVFAQFGFPGAEELANMFEVQRLYIPRRKVDLIESYALNNSMQDFKSWLIKNKEKFDKMFKAQLKPA
jgi:uncharacterized protein YbjT (DUF2867 family)